MVYSQGAREAHFNPDKLGDKKYVKQALALTSLI